MTEWSANDLSPLIEDLESEDAFARLDAIERLEGITRRTFGFRFNDPAPMRDGAVRRWREWVEGIENDRRQDEQLMTAVQLSGGAFDLGALKKAIQEIPTDKIQGYLNALILKMKGQPSRCEACHVRPGTVKVTEIQAGGPQTVHLCDSCARERGDILL
ncbi:MAG: hypothetical protein ABFS86_16175 [Planctomycetota bacterium]